MYETLVLILLGTGCFVAIVDVGAVPYLLRRQSALEKKCKQIADGCRQILKPTNARAKADWRQVMDRRFNAAVASSYVSQAKRRLPAFGPWRPSLCALLQLREAEVLIAKAADRLQSG